MKDNIDIENDWVVKGGHYNDDETFTVGTFNIKQAKKIKDEPYFQPFGIMGAYCDGTVHTQFLEFDKSWTKADIAKEMNAIALKFSKKKEG